MCFKKEVCRDCESFSLIDFKSHDFSVEVFTPPCQYRFNPIRVKCCFPEFRKLYISIVHYYHDFKEVSEDVKKKR